MQFAFNMSFIKNETQLAMKYPDFWGQHFLRSIQLGTVNIPVEVRHYLGSTPTLTAHLGLYSLNGSTLSLLNSASFSSEYPYIDAVSVQSWFSFTGFNASTILPGTWYWGLWLSSTTSIVVSAYFGNLTNLALFGDLNVPVFVCGRHTTSSSGLPETYDVTNAEGKGQYYILVSGS